MTLTMVTMITMIMVIVMIMMMATIMVRTRSWKGNLEILRKFSASSIAFVRKRK